MRDEDDTLEVPWVAIMCWCAAIGLILFLLNAAGFMSFSVWAPKYEEVRRTTWEESASHINGKRQYLTRLYGEWSSAQSAHKSAICAVARQEASTINRKYLPETLRSWECIK